MVAQFDTTRQRPRSNGGLLATVKAYDRLHEVDDRFGSGAEMQLWGCADGAVYYNPCDVLGIVARSRPSTDTRFPLETKVIEECSTFSNNVGDLVANAENDLARRLEFGLGTEIESGNLATAAGWDNPFLTQAANLIGVGTLSPTMALAAAERYAQQNCSQSGDIAIWATADLVTLWAANFLVAADEDGVIRTIAFGTPVISANGFDGLAPGNIVPPAGVTTIYLTALPEVWLGNVHVLTPEDAPDVRTENNTNQITVTQMALATFDSDCCFAYAAVELCAPACP